MILAWKISKVSVASHQKEAQGGLLPWKKLYIELHSSAACFQDKPWKKYVVQNEIGCLVCRVLINCLLSAKENDFSFDKVDDYTILSEAVEWPNFLYPELNSSC